MPAEEHMSIQDLVSRWRQLRQQGQPVSAEELCADCPDRLEELKRHLRDVAAMQDFLRLSQQQLAPEPAKPGVQTSPEAEGQPVAPLAPTSSSPPPERIGRYKLLEPIGEGGMGSVWVAEQTQPVRRKVALKLIKAGMDSKAVLARFEAERQALALMDHPHIAKVLDGGTTENGRPYFVMELVKGVPFTKYCDDARLSIAERLELFVPVCQAVQHAHQKGIIHRDLKPSNILVCLYDGVAVPKVIDFGLAKALHQPLTEHTLYTAQGQMLGTPLYMSPEQAEHNNLDVDTRTDIYALGVILYELLTGTTPLEAQRFKAAAWQEMLRLIKEEEPPRPSARLSGSGSLPSVAAQRRLEPVKLTRLVRGELDWIVMRCLEKDRGRRYETANGLARDLGRYLADEPVEACPPSSGYRLRKFLRKHKAGLATAAAFAVLLMLGVAVSTWLAVRAMRAETAALGLVAETEAARSAEVEQRQIAEAAEKKAAGERDRAVKAEAETAKEYDRAVLEKKRADKQAEITRAVNDFLQGDLLLQASPVATARQRDLAMIKQKARSIVQFDTSAQADPDLKMRTVLDRAGERIRDRFRDQPLIEAAIRHTIGLAYDGLGMRANARDQLEKSVRLFRQSLGPDEPDILEALEDLAMLDLYQQQGDRPEAILVECLQTRRRVNGEKDRSTLLTMTHLAAAYFYQGKLSEAEELIERVLDGKVDVSMQQMDNDPLLGWAAHILALVYKVRGQLEKAEVLNERFLAAAKRWWGEADPYVIDVMHNLASVYSGRGKDREAEDLFLKCLELRRKVLGEDHPDTLWTMYRMAGMYRRQRKFDRAEELYHRAAEGQSRVLGPDVWQTLRTRSELWELYSSSKKHSQADDLMKRHLDEVRSKAGADAIPYAYGLDFFGSGLLQQGRPMEAEPILRECLAIRERKLPDDWLRFNTISLVGTSLLGQKQYAEAEPLLLQGYEGLKQREARIPANVKVRLTEAMERLVQLYDAWGKKDQADAWRKKLEESKATTKPPAQP
jgi:non-specific serine/threonine protein kinase/serine/threonine-protein kinase